MLQVLLDSSGGFHVCPNPSRLLYWNFGQTPLGLVMRIAYLDCFSGISGDMFLGAAVDAGVPLEKLQTVASALGLNAELASRRVERGGLAATKIDVLINGCADLPRDSFP